MIEARESRESERASVGRLDLLSVDHLSVSYGAIRAVRSVSLRVGAWELVALLGANGAGKTTILRSLSGLIPKAGGKVRFVDSDITDLRPHQVAKAGLSHIPEGRQVFAPMTVSENLDLGAYARRGVEVEADREYVFSLFPILKERRRQLAGSLSGGEQQMLAFGRALMARPKLILMDEPSLGLAPRTTDFLYEAIGKINADGTAILLVEQNAERALEVAHRVYVLERGEIAMQGSAEQVAADPAFVHAYLGPAAAQDLK